MASEKDATCENDPNFAIICAFFQKFSTMLNIQHPDIQLLKEWLENTDEVSPGLKELHIKLLRKLRKTVHETAWETALAKFCYMYSSQDAWEIERFGYKKSSLKVKLRILKELLEYQFERNGKFRNNFSALTADELRSEPIGRDKLGHSYWLTQDRHCNLRIYQEHLDEEIWQVVATNREELVTLITRLRGNEVVLPSIVSVVDEDSSSNSCTAAVVKPPPPEEQEDDESQEEKTNETEGKIPNIKIKLDTNEIVITENGAAEREAYSDSESDYRGEEDGDLYDNESEQIVEEKPKDDDDNLEEVNEEKKEDPVVCNEQVNGETKASDVQKNVEAKAPNEQTNGETNGSAEKTKISETIEPEHRNGYVEDVETERKVKPIVISQAKISSEKSSKKRILEDSDKVVEEENLSKKSRPTLLGNNREKKKSKYEKFNDESDDEDDEDDEGEEGEEENTEDEGAAEEEQEEGEEEELGEEEEDEEEDEEEELGEEIEEEVMVIKCDGNGKECESSYLDFLKFDNVDIEGSVGEAIEEEVMFIVGEGSGKDCLVGNDKDNNEKQDICCNEADSKTESDNRKKDCQLAIEKEVEVTSTKSNISSDIQPNETDKAIAEINSLEELTNGEKLSKPRVNLRKRKGDVTEANSDNVENSVINESSSASRIERSPPAIRILEKRPSPSPCPKTESAKFEVPKIEVTEVNANIEKNATNLITEQQHEEDKLKIPDVPKDCELLPNTDIKPTISNETELKSKDSTGVQQNRKRRLDKESSRQNSESETDFNSEIIEEHTEEDVDIGGKRPKMRCKVINSNIRKKIEAERKDVIKESSSSGSEEEISTKDIIRKSPTESVDKIVEDVDGKTSDKIEKLNDVVCNIPVDLEEEEKEMLDVEEGKKSLTETLPIEKSEKVDTLPTETPSIDTPETIKTVSTETPEKVKTVSTETPEEVKTVYNATSERGKTVSTPSSGKVKTVSTTTTDKFETLSTEISEKVKTVCTETPEKVKTVSTATPEKIRIVSTAISEKVKIVSTVKPEKEIIEILDTEKPEEVKTLRTETTGSVDIEKSIKSLGETAENIISIKEDVSIVEKSPEREVILLQIQTRSGRKNPIVFPKLPTPNRRRTKTLNIIGLKNAPMGKKAKTDEKEDSTTTDDIKEDLKKVTDPCRNDVDKVEDTENSITIEPSDPENSSPPGESPKTTCTTENSHSASLSPVEDKKLSPDNTTKDAVKRKQRQQLEIDVSNIIDAEAEGIPVRQSRRIAQLKIREEAERRKLEEIALKKMKAELKKKKKEEQKNTKDGIENETENENEIENENVIEHEKSESSDKNESIDSEVEMKKKVEKKRRGLKKGGWSSGTEDEPEEEEEEFQYETDVGSPLFKSDHEFSPESDIEDESQIVPMKRARTARREGEEGTDVEDGSDESCQKCGKSDHPEWILLCDKCDKGYHCSCLSPVLFIIPEGDWFCPPCQQEQLIQALEIHLKEFDDLIIKRKEEEELRVQNLELAKLALEKQARVISAGKQPRTKPGRRSRKLSSNYRGGSNSKGLNDDDSSRSERTSTKSSDSSSGSSSSSSSTRSSASDSDDEPIYKLRKRRQINVSYQFHEYDDLINSAIKEEMDEVAGAGNLGRGKDISTIIEADKEEKLRLKQLEAQRELQDSEDAAKANIVAVGDCENTEVKKEEEVVPPVKDENKANEDSGSDFEPFKPRPKLSSRRNIKKKNRKLNSLDISSEDDGSDEDFKTSSYETEEEDESISAASESDSSLEIYKHKSKKNKKNSRRSTRRAARQRRKRYDDDFIVEDSDCSVVFPKIKKKRRDDTDYTESEDMSEDLDSEDLCDDSTDSDSDGAWRPSKRKKQRTSVKKNQPKKKSFSKQKKHKRTSNEKSFKTGMSKNRIRDYDDENSMDSGRRTRGKRFTYLEDYEDESSDDGIKPGVKRPDTPPEEREKFIRRQEEIKRMLAEKNTEAAKVAATPTLIPISRPNKPQASVDPSTSLSTVPLSVIKSAKALDIDYLQRKGELESDDPDTDFDDDLPEDFNPEDMDEEEIAKMMEEEDFAQQQLKLAGEAIRQKKLRETDSSSKSEGDIFRIQRATPAPIYDTTRKRFPIPTPHPPLRNQSFYQMPHSNPTFSRGGVPPNRYLPQQSGRPLLPPPLQTNSPSVHSNLLVHTNTSLSSSHTVQAISPVPNTQISTVLSQVSPQGEPLKPRGRRKKITPLRDTLQKQQAAAAAAAAAAASCVVGQPTQAKEDTSPGRDKPAGGNLSVAQPPQLYKPSNNAQPSVITRMAQPARPRFSDQGPRFFGPLNQMGQRPPPTIRPMSVPSPHHPMRPSYAAGPPPLRPANNRPPQPVSLGNGISRHPLPPRPPLPFNGPEQFSLRPRTAPALNPYRPPLYGTPGFPPAPPGHSSPQGPPPPQAPNSLHSADNSYTAPSFTAAPFGSYYPPPIGTTHSTPPPPTATAVPSSVIVSATANTSPPPVSAAAEPIIQPSPPIPSRPKATPLETFDSKSTPPPEPESVRSPYSSSAPADEIDEEDDVPRNSTSEFSGLVSYFSSQQDDLNT